MRAAVISDLHGNLEAVNAVWTDIEDVDRIYCLGDTVGIGPDPAEVLEMILDDPRVRWVMGNHEYNTVYGTELGPMEDMPRRPHHDWVRAEIGDLVDEMEPPLVIGERIGGKDVIFMHRHPDDCASKVPYYDRPYPEVLDGFYSDVKGDILFFGHTHIPLYAVGGEGRTYINPGSVGAQNAGSATYVMIDDGAGDVPGISRRVREYDKGPLLKRLKKKQVPYHEFISRHFFGDVGFVPMTVKDF